jgi:hypothetical protein
MGQLFIFPWIYDFSFLAGPDIMAMESEDTRKHARIARLEKRFADSALKMREMKMPLSTVNTCSITFTVACYSVVFNHIMHNLSLWFAPLNEYITVIRCILICLNSFVCNLTFLD